MAKLDLRRVAFAHTDAAPLLEEVDLGLDAGWTGVVGPNGAGKTTLIRLMAGELEPDQGQVTRLPGDGRFVICPQRVDESDPLIQAFAGSGARNARRLRGQLSLDAAPLDAWATLSPGERKRWQIGAGLAAEPDWLALDEPTNHLDAQARGLLVDALQRFGGIGLIVSHDRALLESLTDRTIRVAHGRAVLFRGAYETARRSWQADEATARQERDRLQHERRAMKKRIGDGRRDRAQAESRMRTSRNMKGIHDSAARGRYKAKRRRSAEVSLGRKIHKDHARLDRIESKLAGLRVVDPAVVDFFVDYQPCPQPTLASLAAGPHFADPEQTHWLAELPEIVLRRDSRIHLAGPNGAGKSTLVRRLLEAMRIPDERLIYLPQEITAREGALDLEALRELPPDRRGRRLALLDALGVDVPGLLASAAPSPGEARKMRIADGLERQVWALVFDEPTNHLDLPSVEKLEETLRCYPGAIVLVSHDEAFARAIVDEIWRFESGALTAEQGAGDAP